MRILLFSVAGILVLLGILYALLRTSYVQTYLVKYITERIEKKAGVKIQVGGVDFYPMKSLVLNDVLLKDFKDDTLLYCRDLSVKMDSFSFIQRKFTVKKVLLEEAYFNLWVTREGQAKTNIEMFLDSLRREDNQGDKRKQADENVKGWLVNLEGISFRNSRFTYREDRQDTVDYGVNWTDIDCRELNVDVSGFDFKEDVSRLNVSGLSFVEKSGLRMEKLEGKLAVWENRMLITECRIMLERSNVDLVKLEYRWTPNRHDWRNFVTKMQQYYELGPSAVSFIDLAYFNGILRGIDNTVKCSGIVTGTIDRLEGRELYFELGEQSVFQGHFRSQGLPDVRKTHFDIHIHDAHLNPSDLGSVYLPWFDMNIPVPGPLYKLKHLDFERIDYSGVLDRFQVKAKSNTSALAGELNFSYSPCLSDSLHCSEMNGAFDFRQVDFRRLSGFPFVRNGVFRGIYNGRLEEGGNTIFNVKGKFPVLNLQKGQVRDLSLFLGWENGKTDVMAFFDNENARSNLVMRYDTGDSVDFISTKGYIEVTDLKKFGWELQGEGEAVQSEFDYVYAGKEKNNFSNLSLTDVSYVNSKGGFTLDSVTTEMAVREGYCSVNVKSDVADLFMDGHWKDFRLSKITEDLLGEYLPVFASRSPNKKRSVSDKGIDFKYGVDIKDANRILQVLYPQFGISEGSRIRSHFRSGEELVHLSVVADTIRYKDFRLIRSGLELKGNEERLWMLYTGDRMIYHDAYQLHNVRNELVALENRVDNKISWGNWGARTYSGELSAGVSFIPVGKNKYRTEVRIDPGVMILADSIWRVRRSDILIDGKEVDIRNFAVDRGDQYLLVKGKLSEDPDEKLSIDLYRFNLNELNRLFFNEQAPVFGHMTGNLTVQDYYSDRVLTSDVNIDEWGIGRDTLGSLHFRSYWDADNRNLILGAENRIDTAIPLKVAGLYVPATDSLNVKLQLAQVGVGRMESYFKEYLSEVSGGISGEMEITGTTLMPNISGFIYLDSIGLKVNLLNTNFSVSDSLHITNNRVLLKDLVVKDVAGHQAVLNGDYQFWEQKYDLNLKFANYLLLNTDFSQNEMIYGRVALSGLVELNNQDGIPKVAINARTENNSILYIPLTDNTTEQANNFLHFVNTERQIHRRQIVTNDEIPIDLNANLEVNDNLEVQVVFDPMVGDILKTSGNGDIKVAFDKDGHLSMFGEYRITKGNYLFTLRNLVNKKFVLTPGGTITWNGSPYDALLDINAVYSLKASVYELLADSGMGDVDTDAQQSTEKGKKVPVECILNLTDHLTNPMVKFNINFPTLESQTKSYIQSLFSSQDEVNKQMFSLLVLNKFYRTDNSTANFGEQAQNASLTTFMEMMSNQVSRLVSQFSENLDIGFSYHFGDRAVTPDEFEVALSTQLLNDRITLSANGNMDVGGNKSTVTNKSNNTNIAGDFDLEVKLNKQGTLKLKAYSHTDEKIIYNTTEMIQGVGISYQESFDTVKDLLRKYFGFLRSGKKE